MKRHKAAKARTVAHHHKHVKPAHAHHKAATGHAHKHHKAHKHHHIAHKHKGQVHRGLALGDAAACCAAEALAASLRLAGHPVGDADVLALHRLAGADDELGAPLAVLLEAASEFGLAGAQLLSFGEARGVAPPAGIGPLQVPLFTGAHIPTATLTRHRPADTASTSPGVSLLLGVDLPGPHTVLAAPGGWWSWGELWCPWCEFPDAVIEEAWAVTWR